MTAGIQAVAEVYVPHDIDLWASWDDRPPLRRLLVLDAVQDPGNLVSSITCSLQSDATLLAAIPHHYVCPMIQEHFQRTKRDATSLDVGISSVGHQYSNVHLLY